MSQPSSVSINPSLTSLPGTTGAPTPSTFSQSMGASATVVAVLTDTDAHTTITAYQIASTTGLAVVDGTTLTWRHEGITLGNGDVVSLGFNGLEDSTTTANYRVMTVTSSASGGSGGSETSGASSTGGNTDGGGGGATATSKKSTQTQSAASTSSSGTAPTMGAGKALALIGGLAGMVAFGL